MAEAHREAEALHHAFVGTEHLLLSLAADTEGVGGAVLRALGVNRDKLRDRVREVVQPLSMSTPAPEALPLTARAVKALTLAEDAARSFGHSYVGPEHLLIGMLMDQKSIASAVLSEWDVSETRARDETLRILGPLRDANEFPR